MSQVTKLTSLKAFQDATQSNVTAVVLFYKENHQLSKIARKVFLSRAQVVSIVGKIQFYEVDVETVPEAAEESGVYERVPAFATFKDGNKVEGIFGAAPLPVFYLVERARQL